MHSFIVGGLSIVIPVFNEEENILPLIAEIQQVLNHVSDYEIIIVDDHSTDGTSERIQSLSKCSLITLIKHSSNLGQSIALLNGIQSAQYRWIATLDGDGQNNPQDLLKLIEQMMQMSSSDSGNFACFGIRTSRQDHWKKRWSSKIANYIRRIFLKDDCPDTCCGIKLFSKSQFMKIIHFKNCHRFLPALFKHSGAEVIFVPVSHRPRMKGVSKYGTFDRFIAGIIDLIGVAWLIHRTKDLR